MYIGGDTMVEFKIPGCSEKYVYTDNQKEAMEIIERESKGYGRPLYNIEEWSPYVAFNLSERNWEELTHLWLGYKVMPKGSKPYIVEVLTDRLKAYQAGETFAYMEVDEIGLPRRVGSKQKYGDAKRLEVEARRWFETAQRHGVFQWRTTKSSACLFGHSKPDNFIQDLYKEEKRLLPGLGKSIQNVEEYLKELEGLKKEREER